MLLSFTHVGCEDGNIRLMNGSTSLEGRVEVCYDNTYWTVCDDFWDELDAQVVCNQLEYPDTATSCKPQYSLDLLQHCSLYIRAFVCVIENITELQHMHGVNDLKSVVYQLMHIADKNAVLSTYICQKFVPTMCW